MSDEKKSIWPMTDVQIAAIRERSDKATDGPWGVFRECGGRKRFGIATQKSLDDNDTGELDAIVDYEGRDSGILKEADAAFIAHAREDVPALLAEVARLQKVARLIGLHREAENKKLEQEAAKLADLMCCYSDARCPVEIDRIDFTCPHGRTWDEEGCIPFEDEYWRAAAAKETGRPCVTCFREEVKTEEESA